MYKCSSYSTYSLHCSSFLWVNQFYIRDPKIYSPKKELQWRLYRYILAVFLGVDCQASSHTLNVLHPEVVTSLHNAQRSRDICSEITRSCSEITRRHASSREISRDLAISRDVTAYLSLWGPPTALPDPCGLRKSIYAILHPKTGREHHEFLPRSREKNRDLA